LRTVIIDADLRAPMIGEILMPGRQVDGLTDWLEAVSPQIAIHTSEVDNLWVIPAGRIAVSPAELLAKSTFGDLIRELEQQFDFIVIDTAPILTVSDTLLLVEHAQSVCLVAQAGKTARESVLRATKLLTEAGAKPSGLLLNKLSHQAGTGYYPYGTKYGARETYSTPPHMQNGVRQIPGPANEAA
jgi:capsular exopolysaccharide synthesis family protein